MSTDSAESTSYSASQRPLDLGRPKGPRQLMDTAMRLLIWMATLIALVPLVWIVISVVSRGAPLLFTKQPDYTRICTIASVTTVKGEAPYQRVPEGECTAGNAKATYRWVVGGVYPAVGGHLRDEVQSVSRDPNRRGPTYVVAAPNSDGAGTVRLFTTDWWTKDVGASPDQVPGGGALHAIVGTLWIGLITSAIAVPLAILGATFLVEYARGKRVATVVSFMVDILTGVPSIVAALFIFAVVITIGGWGRSASASSLALVILMLPTVLRSTEEMLKLVPDSLREASYALGVPKWKTITSVVIPTAFKGIATGAMLGLARVMGETAPLLILLNYARNLDLSPFSRTMGSLPTMIANAASLPADYPGAERGWAAAFTLMLIVMGLNLVAKYIGRTKKS